MVSLQAAGGRDAARDLKSPSLLLSPMNMGAEALRHHALVYDGDEDYATLSAGFLHEGLNAGECCVVAHHRAGLAMMRDALGRDASWRATHSPVPLPGRGGR